MTFTVDDLALVGDLALETWSSGADRDWSVPAGSLGWTCWQTADHTIDCVFSFALFLGSRRTTDYPPFDLLRALPEAGPADLVDGLRAVLNILVGTIATAPPDANAILLSSRPPIVGRPVDFAARGALELVLHTHDIAAGLGLAFDPPAEPCRRLLAATAGYPGHHDVPPSDDPWAMLLGRSGR